MVSLVIEVIDRSCLLASFFLFLRFFLVFATCLAFLVYTILREHAVTVRSTSSFYIWWNYFTLPHYCPNKDTCAIIDAGSDHVYYYNGDQSSGGQNISGR